VFTVALGPRLVLAGLAAIPIALLARFMAVGVAVTAMRLRGEPARGMLAILTWSGLRGGLSVAMVLSLPPFPARDLLLTSTYCVVVFSVLVQGLTMRRLLRHYGVGSRAAS
jgi:CPA1 family monovalent cation:H+ antiporter